MQKIKYFSLSIVNQYIVCFTGLCKQQISSKSAQKTAWITGCPLQIYNFISIKATRPRMLFGGASLSLPVVPVMCSRGWFPSSAWL